MMTRWAYQIKLDNYNFRSTFYSNVINSISKTYFTFITYKMLFKFNIYIKLNLALSKNDLEKDVKLQLQRISKLVYILKFKIMIIPHFKMHYTCYWKPVYEICYMNYDMNYQFYLCIDLRQFINLNLLLEITSFSTAM